MLGYNDGKVKKTGNKIVSYQFLWIRRTCDYIEKVKANYFIVRAKVDQRVGLLNLPHLGNFRRTATFTTSAFTS